MGSENKPPHLDHPAIKAPGPSSAAASETVLDITSRMREEGTLTDFLRTLSRAKNPADLAREYGVTEEEIRTAWIPRSKK